MHQFINAKFFLSFYYATLHYKIFCLKTLLSILMFHNCNLLSLFCLLLSIILWERCQLFAQERWFENMEMEVISNKRISIIGILDCLLKYPFSKYWHCTMSIAFKFNLCQIGIWSMRINNGSYHLFVGLVGVSVLRAFNVFYLLLIIKLGGKHYYFHFINDRPRFIHFPKLWS